MKGFRDIWIFPIFGSALLIRLLSFFSLQRTLPLLHRIGDSREYDNYAWKIVTGAIQTETLHFNLNSAYLFFLSSIYRLFGHQVIMVQIIQILLGSITCVLIYKLASAVWDPIIGRIAGFAASFYGLFIFSDGLISKGSLANFLLVAGLYLLIKLPQPLQVIPWVLGTCFITVAALMRTNLLAFLPVLLIWTITVSQPQVKKRMLCAGVLIAASFLTVQGFQHWFDRAVPHKTFLAVEPGVHFYIGNNASADGAYKIQKEFSSTAQGHSRDAVHYVEKIKGHTVTPNEANQYWLKQGLHYIRNHPWAWVKLEMRKLVLTFNAFEIPSFLYYDYVRRKSFVLSFPLLSFALISPLGLLGIFLALRKPNPAEWLLLGLVASYTLSLLFFFVQMDYRMPLQIPMLLFAANAVKQLFFIYSAERAAPKVRISLLLLFLFAVTNFEAFMPKTQYYSLMDQRARMAHQVLPKNPLIRQ